MNLGKRQTKTVTNMDNLTEAQFLRVIEEGADLQDAIKNDNKRRK